MQEKVIMISAGEPSGDLHGSNLIKTILRFKPTTKIYALGGPKMRSAGAIMLAETVAHSVIGIKGIIKSFIYLYRVFCKSKELIRNLKPKCIVLIDFPEFNIPLSQYAYRQGVPAYYFVPPQIWVWRKSRVYKIRKTCKYIFTTLPIEDNWYRLRRTNTNYVGHPYFEYHKQLNHDHAFIRDLREKYDFIITLFPGSRTNEVINNINLAIQLANLLTKNYKNKIMLIGAYNQDLAQLIEQNLGRSVIDNIKIIAGKTADLILVSDICIAASGSISLELLYYCKPAIIVYRIDYISLFLARILIKMKTITLVNILAKKIVFPELITYRLTLTNEKVTSLIRCVLNERTIKLIKTELSNLRDKLVDVNPTVMVTSKISRHQQSPPEN